MNTEKGTETRTGHRENTRREQHIKGRTRKARTHRRTKKGERSTQEVHKDWNTPSGTKRRDSILDRFFLALLVLLLCSFSTFSPIPLCSFCFFSALPCSCFSVLSLLLLCSISAFPALLFLRSVSTPFLLLLCFFSCSSAPSTLLCPSRLFLCSFLLCFSASSLLLRCSFSALYFSLLLLCSFSAPSLRLLCSISFHLLLLLFFSISSLLLLCFSALSLLLLFSPCSFSSLSLLLFCSVSTASLQSMKLETEKKDEYVKHS